MNIATSSGKSLWVKPNNLRTNSEINQKKKPTKGLLELLWIRTQKTEEGLEQVANEKCYEPLEEPIVSQTALKSKQ